MLEVHRKSTNPSRLSSTIDSSACLLSPVNSVEVAFAYDAAAGATPAEQLDWRESILHPAPEVVAFIKDVF
jgi:hypothetical protein